MLQSSKYGDNWIDVRGSYFILESISSSWRLKIWTFAGFCGDVVGGGGCGGGRDREDSVDSKGGEWPSQTTGRGITGIAHDSERRIANHQKWQELIKAAA